MIIINHSLTLCNLSFFFLFSYQAFSKFCCLFHLPTQHWLVALLNQISFSAICYTNLKLCQISFSAICYTNLHFCYSFSTREYLVSLIKANFFLFSRLIYPTQGLHFWQKTQCPISKDYCSSCLFSFILPTF